MEPSFTVGNANGTATLMTGWWLLIKLNPLLLQDPAIVLIWHPTPVLLPENPMDGGAW